MIFLMFLPKRGYQNYGFSGYEPSMMGKEILRNMKSRIRNHLYPVIRTHTQDGERVRLTFCQDRGGGYVVDIPDDVVKYIELKILIRRDLPKRGGLYLQ